MGRTANEVTHEFCPVSSRMEGQRNGACKIGRTCSSRRDLLFCRCIFHAPKRRKKCNLYLIPFIQSKTLCTILFYDPIFSEILYYILENLWHLPHIRYSAKFYLNSFDFLILFFRNFTNYTQNKSFSQKIRGRQGLQQLVVTVENQDEMSIVRHKEIVTGQDD